MVNWLLTFFDVAVVLAIVVAVIGPRRCWRRLLQLSRMAR